VINEHFNAVRDLLAAHASIAGNLHDSALVNASGKLIRGTYWVLFGGKPDTLGDDRLAYPQRIDADADFVYTVRSVSTTADLCRQAAAAAFAQLVGAELEVAGRDCAAIAFVRGEDPHPDDEISPPLYYCDDEYSLHSSRA
jgi:hypothetical protein